MASETQTAQVKEFIKDGGIDLGATRQRYQAEGTFAWEVNIISRPGMDRSGA